MSRTDIQNTPIEENRLGLTHFAFAFDSQEAVLRQTERLRTADIPSQESPVPPATDILKVSSSTRTVTV